MALGLFWDIATGLPWTPNGVGSLEPKGYCIFLPGAHYLTINSPYGADSSLNKLLLLLLLLLLLHDRSIYLSGITIKTGFFIKSWDGLTYTDKKQQKLNNVIILFHSISNESCKPLHLNCEIKHKWGYSISCSICRGYPLWCLSTPKFVLNPQKNSKNESKMHCWSASSLVSHESSTAWG